MLYLEIKAMLRPDGGEDYLVTLKTRVSSSTLGRATNHAGVDAVIGWALGGAGLALEQRWV